MPEVEPLSEKVPETVDEISVMPEDSDGEQVDPYAAQRAKQAEEREARKAAKKAEKEAKAKEAEEAKQAEERARRDKFRPPRKPKPEVAAGPSDLKVASIESGSISPAGSSVAGTAAGGAGSDSADGGASVVTSDTLWAGDSVASPGRGGTNNENANVSPLSTNNLVEEIATTGTPLRGRVSPDDESWGDGASLQSNSLDGEVRIGEATAATGATLWGDSSTVAATIPALHSFPANGGTAGSPLSGRSHDSLGSFGTLGTLGAGSITTVGGSMLPSGWRRLWSKVKIVLI